MKKLKFIFILVLSLVCITAKARVLHKTINGIYYFEYEETSDNGGKRLIKISGPVDANNKPNGVWTGKVIDTNLMTTNRTVWNGTLQLTRGYKNGTPDGVYKFTDTRSFRYRRGGGGKRNELYTGAYKNGRPHGIWNISSPLHNGFKATLKYDHGVLISKNTNDDSPYPSLEYYMRGGEFRDYYTGGGGVRDMDEMPIFEKSQAEKEAEAEGLRKREIREAQSKAWFECRDKMASYKPKEQDTLGYIAANFGTPEEPDSVNKYLFA